MQQTVLYLKVNMSEVFIKTTYDLEKSLLHAHQMGILVSIIPHVDTNQSINKIEYEIVFQSEEDANLFKITHPHFKQTHKPSRVH